jgi:CubicO group peptidase (beta-lactamase class C family)
MPPERDSPGALAPDGLRTIDDALTGFIDAGEIAGASIAVTQRGETVHEALLGLKDIARREPLADDTIFRIYSMTKPVTAVAMMTLWDRGLWAPDDPIEKHLPEFANLAGPGGAALAHAPTLGDLMTHTAGFGYGIGAGPHDATDKAYIAAGIWEADGLADFARRVAAIPLAYQPGEAWRYSLSMDLQGAIIERLTGETLPDYLGRHVFEPLGMADTGFFVPDDKLPRLATLYHRYGTPTLSVLDNPAWVRDPRRVPSVPSGGGGLYATRADYGRFAQMLLNGGELAGVRVISRDAARLMMTNHLPDAIIARGVDAGFQRIGPGRGYAYNGAVFIDPAAAGSPVGRGTYQWDGASGVWFWVDPENQITFVGMIQRMMQEGMPRFQELTQAMVAAALGPPR